VVKSILYEGTIALGTSMDSRKDLWRSEPRGDSGGSGWRKEAMETWCRIHSITEKRRERSRGRVKYGTWKCETWKCKTSSNHSNHSVSSLFSADLQTHITRVTVDRWHVVVIPLMQNITWLHQVRQSLHPTKCLLHLLAVSTTGRRSVRRNFWLLRDAVTQYHFDIEIVVMYFFIPFCLVLRVGRTVDHLSPLLTLIHLPHGRYYCEIWGQFVLFFCGCRGW